MTINFKREYFFILTIMNLISLNSNAQSFQWSKNVPSITETDYEMDYWVSNKLYQISSKYNLDVFNKDVRATSYFLDNLDRDKTNDLSIEQPTIGKAMMTHLKMFQEKGENGVIFLDEFNTKTRERELFWQRVNVDTNVKTNPALITSMPGRNSNYTISQSQNKLFYAVIKEYTLDKKTNEKINITLLDKDFKIIKEITYETPYLNKSPFNNDLYVSNQGSVFIIKYIDLAKMRPFKTVFFWDGKTETLQENSLKFDNDYQIYQYRANFNNDDFYVQGLYTKTGSKGFQIGSDAIPAAGIYAARFNEKGEKKYTEASETGQIVGLNLKDFAFDSNKTWFFADKMMVSKKAKPVAPGSFKYEYDYTYSNNAFVFGKIDNDTGKLEWFKDIPFEEHSTTNDDGIFLSYLHFISNNQLIILFNDTQPTVIEGHKASDRFTAIETYDDRGNPVSKSLIPETGLELKYNHGFEENFDLDTSLNIKIQDGKYIVRAKSPYGNEKNGYLTF
ncbi:MAG TPA: hypothetical protein VIV55_10440 [Flavobacterium sp.]